MDFKQYSSILWFFAGCVFTVFNLLSVYWLRVWQLRKKADAHEGISQIRGTTYFKVIFNPADLSDDALRCLVKELERIESADNQKAQQCKRKKSDINHSSNERHLDE